MILNLYHGSKNIVGKPVYDYPKDPNTASDYGNGFYLTPDIDMAKEWSVSSESENGYVNKYTLDTSGLKVLNLKKYLAIYWITLLIKNRGSRNNMNSDETYKYLEDNFSLNTSSDKIDVIQGYRADDRYFRIPLDFVSNQITYGQLCHALHLGGLGEQFMLNSPKSYERIKFKGAEVVRGNEWFVEKSNRLNAANKDYENIKTTRKKNDLTIMQIIDKKINAKNAEKILRGLEDNGQGL